MSDEQERYFSEGKLVCEHPVLATIKGDQEEERRRIFEDAYRHYLDRRFGPAVQTSFRLFIIIGFLLGGALGFYFGAMH